jgi:hypothetical protein
VAAVGCRLLFVPPYSPDLNPIEHLWAAFKTRLRKDPATHYICHAVVAFFGRTPDSRLFRFSISNSFGPGIVPGALRRVELPLAAIVGVIESPCPIFFIPAIRRRHPFAFIQFLSADGCVP